MNEIIQSIQEFEYDDGNAGYIIKTDKQEIEIGIDMDTWCCEMPGYFMTNDDVSDFIGSDILSISVVDTARNVKDIFKKKDVFYCDEETYIMFVNIETSVGQLQFVCYNTHNGYYGHAAYIKSIQVTEEVGL